MSKFEPLFHKLSADRDHIYLIPSHSLGTWSRAEPTADNHQYLWNEWMNKRYLKAGWRWHAFTQSPPNVSEPPDTGCRDQECGAGRRAGGNSNFSVFNSVLIPQGPLDLEKLWRIWTENKNDEGCIENISEVAWRIPGTGEPGGLPSMGSHGVGHDWSDAAAAAAAEWNI